MYTVYISTNGMAGNALVEWLHFHRLFQDFFVFSTFVFSTIKFHCMGDSPKYWVNRIDSIEWLGYATNASQHVSCIQVSIAIAANLAYS